MALHIVARHIIGRAENQIAECAQTKLSLDTDSEASVVVGLSYRLWVRRPHPFFAEVNSSRLPVMPAGHCSLVRRMTCCGRGSLVRISKLCLACVCRFESPEQDVDAGVKGLASYTAMLLCPEYVQFSYAGRGSQISEVRWRWASAARLCRLSHSVSYVHNRSKAQIKMPMPNMDCACNLTSIPCIWLLREQRDAQMHGL